MVPITTIDCEGVVPNRFELVLHSATRAPALNRGETSRVWPDGDEPPSGGGSCAETPSFIGVWWG